ncbi:hypothetical protein GWI33_013907 [Rhynchophorus ferrugineus]|uniref:Uncharacterized protein n=1 Tax=Rhynchophorus ferrugineus TaxID=354439 RepID=A0A834I2S4_RHYFE|nr:hypothetical protein GWI33_013907 [Rhynchophorus ferrugineus]
MALDSNGLQTVFTIENHPNSDEKEIQNPLTDKNDISTTGNSLEALDSGEDSETITDKTNVEQVGPSKSEEKSIDNSIHDAHSDSNLRKTSGSATIQMETSSVGPTVRLNDEILPDVQSDVNDKQDQQTRRTSEPSGLKMWRILSWVLIVVICISVLSALGGLSWFYSKEKRHYLRRNDSKEAYMAAHNMTPEDYEINVRGNRTLARRRYPWIPYLWFPNPPSNYILG